jgi:hypothetical protein
MPETVEPGAGASMCAVGITTGAVIVTVTLAEPVSGVALESVAVTVMVCDPVVSVVVFREYEYPTLGQPARPG